MNDLNTFKEVDRKLTRECQRLREDSTPCSGADRGYYTFTLYYHLDDQWGQRVVTRRAEGEVLEAWAFPREPLFQATQLHYETLQQAFMDFLKEETEYGRSLPPL